MLPRVFAPDSELAFRANRRMHAGLADSFQHIIDRLDGQYEEYRPTLERLVGLAQSDQNLPAVAFGWYYDLTFALLDDDGAAAREALGHLESVEPFTVDRTIEAFAPETLAGQLYASRMGSTLDLHFRAPETDDVIEFTTRYADARQLLELAVPELLGEIDHLVREYILITETEESGARFAGSSVYQLWGGLFVNPIIRGKRGTGTISVASPVVIAETIAHEGSHSFLFGHTFDEPLVFNTDDELYASPLRVDPRPMDGIYHATFVSARMHYAMTKLAACRAASSAVRAEAAKLAREDGKNFSAGFAVVKDHGRLSETGQQLMDGAASYMAEAA